ncbi:MAG TPA: hypothetical protein PKE16_16420 [Hyphomicrobium sp.]|nr:hypothetical protein [Hyphomicrobium sp.]
MNNIRRNRYVVQVHWYNTPAEQRETIRAHTSLKAACRTLAKWTKVAGIDLAVIKDRAMDQSYSLVFAKAIIANRERNGRDASTGERVSR